MLAQDRVAIAIQPESAGPMWPAKPSEWGWARACSGGRVTAGPPAWR